MCSDGGPAPSEAARAHAWNAFTRMWAYEISPHVHPALMAALDAAYAIDGLRGRAAVGEPAPDVRQQILDIIGSEGCYCSSDAVEANDDDCTGNCIGARIEKLLREGNK